MNFVYGKQDFRSMARAQENCFLLTNGLGGYASATAAFSLTRGDCGLLIAAKTAPCERIALVHRAREVLTVGNTDYFLSTQAFSGKEPPEDGWRHLSAFSFEKTPFWRYEVGGAAVERKLEMGFSVNETKLSYRVENRSGEEVKLCVTPFYLLCPKGDSRQRKAKITIKNGKISCGEYAVFLKTDGISREIPPIWQRLSYEVDAVDGRRKSGLCFAVSETEITVAPGETKTLTLQFSDNGIFADHWERNIKAPFRSEIANTLAQAAADFISHRASTGGKTIIAGYPFFGDWGRDTMIALPGCVLATKEYDTAKSILSTFLQYEKDGLVPNLFPEGKDEPRYNTVDAALLLINTLWQYHEKTGDLGFIRQAFPTLKRIIAAYQAGTHHGIGMDSDGLIFAGQGLDQVTWMDVCVEGILPTPRHGKPVEINAYWYSALRVMEAFSTIFEENGEEYAALAEKVQKSFTQKFWHPAGFLRDVLSGTSADDQIRCNQIWAVTMPFTMLSREQERSVVETVYRELYTPCGLRTLSPKDPEFRPSYGGTQKNRDLAYHQGTVWVFPLGAYYRAYLKVNGFSGEAIAEVRKCLAALTPMLREGCIGQLPEIYDGENPTSSRGCFAQAWSVGEMLTVYELLEKGSPCTGEA